MTCVRFLHEEEKFIIEQYKSNQCLWKTSDENYYDKKKRNDVLINLAGLFNEVYGKIVSEVDIKKKWKHLRATFGRELKKSLKKTQEAENGEIYRSKWIHFDDLQFLRDETAAELNLDSKIRRLINSNMEDTLEILKEGNTLTPSSVHFKTSENNRKDSIDDFLSYVGKSLRKLPELSIQRCMLKIQNAIFEEFETVENS